jgi:hypothetical protein
MNSDGGREDEGVGGTFLPIAQDVVTAERSVLSRPPMHTLASR